MPDTSARVSDMCSSARVHCLGPMLHSSTPTLAMACRFNTCCTPAPRTAMNLLVLSIPSNCRQLIAAKKNIQVCVNFKHSMQVQVCINIRCNYRYWMQSSTGYSQIVKQEVQIPWQATANCDRVRSNQYKGPIHTDDELHVGTSRHSPMASRWSPMSST